MLTQFFFFSLFFAVSLKKKIEELASPNKCRFAQNKNTKPSKNLQHHFTQQQINSQMKTHDPSSYALQTQQTQSTKTPGIAIL